MKDGNVCFIDMATHPSLLWAAHTFMVIVLCRSLQFEASFDVDELASLHELCCVQTLKLNSLPA